MSSPTLDDVKRVLDNETVGGYDLFGCVIETQFDEAAAAVMALYAPVPAELEQARAEVERLRDVMYKAQRTANGPLAAEWLANALGHDFNCDYMTNKRNACTCGGSTVSPEVPHA